MEEKWWKRWLHPAVITTVIGVIFAGIVWGVQLNFAVLSTASDVGELKGITTKLTSVAQQQATNHRELTVIVKELKDDVEDNEEDIDEIRKELKQ